MNQASNLKTIWDVLQRYRHSQQEDDYEDNEQHEMARSYRETAEAYDAEWDEICTAMAQITEGLGLEISTRDDETNGEYVTRECMVA